MRLIEITYEVTRRACETFEVSDEEYENLKAGELPEDVMMQLEHMIDTGDCDREDDWAAVDAISGVAVQDWR